MNNTVRAENSAAEKKHPRFTAEGTKMKRGASGKTFPKIRMMVWWQIGAVIKTILIKTPSR